MRGSILVASLLMLVATVALAPSASAAEQAAPPIQCVMAPCGPQGIDPCAARTITPTYGYTVYVRDDCSLQIDLKPYDCVWHCSWHTLVQGPPLTVRQFGEDGYDTSAAGAQQPQCLTQSCCVAACPLPVACREFEVRTSDFLAYMGPHAVVGVGSDCRPYVWTDPIVEVAAADLPDLPGPPTFPVCVTEPCDVMVCDEASDGVGVVEYDFTSSCRVIVTVGDFPCEAPYYEDTNAGPVTLRLQRCGPGYPPVVDG